EVLLFGPARHPPDRDAQGRRRGLRQPRPRQGRQEQGRAPVQAGRIRHHLRLGDFLGRHRARLGARSQGGDEIVLVLQLRRRAARSGLEAGLELDRPRLRTLRRELRRGVALAAGAKALARRERSERELRDVLDRKGLGERDREEAVATLRRLGALDDTRFAHARAETLAERGLGDAAIAFRLERDGIDSESSTAALAALETERDRAVRLTERRGAGARTARWL